MTLINVRLTRAEEEAVGILKRSRVEISDVVRAALRHEAEKYRPRTAAFTTRLLDEIFEQYPEPHRAIARSFDVHDRKAFARAFRKHLRVRVRGRGRK